MIVNLPTEKGWVPVNPAYITHITNVGARDWVADKSVVHIDSGATGVAVVALGSPVALCGLLADPDRREFFVGLYHQPDEFPGPHYDPDIDWLDPDAVQHQWQLWREFQQRKAPT